MKYPWVRFFPAPRHDNVVGILQGADVLFHTEGFDLQYLKYIRLSVSSKSQVYMISGVPSDVRAGAAGVVQYRRTAGLRRRPARSEFLQEAIVRLAGEYELRRLVKRRKV